MYAFKLPLVSNDLKLCSIFSLHNINNIIHTQKLLTVDGIFHELVILHLFDNFLKSHSEWKTMQSRVVKVQVSVWHLSLPYHTN